jgi:hypothetical protein
MVLLKLSFMLLAMRRPRKQFIFNGSNELSLEGPIHSKLNCAV